MDVICPISGLRMYRAPYMLGFDFAEVHPIFRAPRSLILSKKFDVCHRFNKAETLAEKSLYFLALVKATDLIDFEVPASPTFLVIEKHFYRVFQFVSWLDYAIWLGVKDEAIFPRFVVREEGKYLDNIDVWIEALEDVMQSFIEKDKTLERKRQMIQEHDRLKAEISRAALKDRMFTHDLAIWTLRITELEKHPKADLFLQVLKLKQAEIFGVDMDLLVELKELIHEQFDFNHPLYVHIMGQMNALIQAHKIRSPNFEIMEGPESYIDDAGNQQTRQVDVADRARQALLDQTGSTERPKREQFIKLIDFLRADARWNLANGKGPQHG